jgi:putative acetyltransferase
VPNTYRNGVRSLLDLSWTATTFRKRFLFGTPGDTLPSMSVAVRPMRDEEARLFLEIHGRSIRGLAAEHYPDDVIAAWAGPAPISDEAVRHFLENPDHEIRLLAEVDGQPVGLGALVAHNTELRACYVVPEAARRGVGSALVKEMERIALDRGLPHLELHASVNAEPFYAALGYDIVERGEHVLRSGLWMAAVKMRKSLAV